jgi:PAS domain S-box-containing protein
MNTAPQPDLGGSADGLRSRLLTLLIDSVSEYAIFAMDDQGYIVTWNRGAQRLKGYTEDEIVGRHFSTFYTEPDIVRDHPAHELEIATREGRYEEEGWRVRKDGTLFWANVVITALRDEDGQIVGFGKVTRDLTDRRRAEQAREKAAKELEEANEQLRTFASAAAHDLAEPLRTVHGFADLLASRYGDRLDDRGRDFLEHVQSGSERMEALIEHLLVYVRAGAPRWRAGDVDSGRAVRRVLRSLDAAIRERGAAVEADTSTFPVIHGDQAAFELVVQNLVSNALKFSGDDPPRVGITVAPDAAGWRFAVADEGIGIPPEVQERAFDPFRRVHGRDDVRGSGLGLAICRRIVESFGGTIEVESAEGEGSTFSFTVPAAEARA